MAHTALLYDEDHGRRLSVDDWVRSALGTGDKVCYVTAAPEPTLQWIDRSPQLSAALEREQLSVLAAQDVVRRAGGDCARMRASIAAVVDDALAEGYPAVALSAEHAARCLMAPRRTDRLAVEEELRRLSATLPVRVLCQYDTLSPRPWILEVSGLHYGAIKDELCAALLQQDRLLLRGEIDASNTDRVARAWQAALRDEVAVFDLAGIDFLAVDSLRRLAEMAAGLADTGRSLTLVNVPRQVRRAAHVAGLVPAPGLTLEEPAVTPAGSLPLP